jgi:hypothetical protein
MNNQELLLDLNRRQLRLESAFSILKADLRELQMRLNVDGHTATPPPLPPELLARLEPAPPPQPPAPVMLFPSDTLPEIPPAAEAPAPPMETAPAQPAGPGFEVQFGRWLARIGVVFALLTLVYFSILVHDKLYHYLGAWSKLSVLTLVSGGLIAAGMRMESRDSKLLVYGRTLAGGGMACLYYTIYGAIYVPQLHVISSPLFGGVLLLAWSAAVLALAERRRSELLSIFALSLAYFSSVITPGNGFTMGTDLLLAATAVIFLLRNAWTGLPYLCLVGTYAGFLRQAVIYRGPLDFDWIGHLPFGPSAVYLTGAWVIFTAGILLSRTPGFASGKRMAFLCLNNGAWVGLLVVAACLGSYPHMGGILGAVGGVFLGAYLLARFLRADAGEVAGAYLAQGLVFATGGVALAYTGVTRGLLITIESVFLVASGAYSRNIILRIGGGATALLGVGFLVNELTYGAHFPWALTFGGALAMLANAWFARRELWNQPREIAGARIVLSSALYTVLALGLLATGICCTASEVWIAPDLAIAALILTASIYVLPLFELPPLAQALLVIAQVLSFCGFNYDLTLGWPYGRRLLSEPHWSQNLVALVTMLLITWWPRQKQVRIGGWIEPLAIFYALAMVAFCYDAVQPHVSTQTWMMGAALLSLVFLAYGAWSRVWAFMASGQILLALSIATFLNPTGGNFPWTWWAAAIPIVVVYLTGWIVRERVPRLLEIEAGSVGIWRIVARVYPSIAIGLLIRWTFGVVPAPEISLALIAFGTAFILGGTHWRSSYAIRSAFVLNLAGICHYLGAIPWTEYKPFTWMDAGAFLLLLAQPAILRRWGRRLATKEESWILIVASSAIAWFFVSNSITALGSGNLTLGWALFAVALIVIGFAAHERRQRWCGLAILVASFIRVAVHDFWTFSDLYKVLTFLVLTVICLGLSFLYYKFADRLKEWL